MTASYHDSKVRPRSKRTLKAVGKRIREFRKARGLSMRDVKALGGPSKATLQLAESGRVSLNIKTLAKLASIFHVRVEEFFLRKDSDLDEVAALVYRMSDQQVAKLLVELTRKVVN